MVGIEQYYNRPTKSLALNMCTHSSTLARIYIVHCTYNSKHILSHVLVDVHCVKERKNVGTRMAYDEVSYSGERFASHLC